MGKNCVISSIILIDTRQSMQFPPQRGGQGNFYPSPALRGRGWVYQNRTRNRHWCASKVY